ncbi:MAG: phosphodiester glycosidase family protein [Paenibacillaceae bacterium]
MHTRAFLLLSLIFCTMICGFFFAFYKQAPSLTEPYKLAIIPTEPIEQHVDLLQTDLNSTQLAYEGIAEKSNSTEGQLTTIHTVLSELIKDTKLESAQYKEQQKSINAMVLESAAHTKEATGMLDTILSKVLGKPIGQTFGERANIKIFSLKDAGYRGYMAKVKLHDPTAVKLVLSGDKVGHKGETTKSAAKRTNAILAINGGGFSKKKGLLYPMGITVVNKVVKTFYDTKLSFIGFNDQGNLVGGNVTSKKQIADMNILQGATFVPTLLKNGKKMTIPQAYAHTKQPRTLIGHFSNGDLLFIVIDGRQKGSSGVTLEEAQDKLLEFNVRDAYTLDGGGSSTFVYKGKVLNNPSDGNERKVVSSFVIVP